MEFLTQPSHSRSMLEEIGKVKKLVCSHSAEQASRLQTTPSFFLERSLSWLNHRSRSVDTTVRLNPDYRHHAFIESTPADHLSQPTAS